MLVWLWISLLPLLHSFFTQKSFKKQEMNCLKWIEKWFYSPSKLKENLNNEKWNGERFDSFTSVNAGQCCWQQCSLDCDLCRCVTTGCVNFLQCGKCCHYLAHHTNWLMVLPKYTHTIFYDHRWIGIWASSFVCWFFWNAFHKYTHIHSHLHSHSSLLYRGITVQKWMSIRNVLHNWH